MILDSGDRVAYLPQDAGVQGERALFDELLSAFAELEAVRLRIAAGRVLAIFLEVPAADLLPQLLQVTRGQVDMDHVFLGHKAQLEARPVIPQDAFPFPAVAYANRRDLSLIDVHDPCLPVRSGPKGPFL